MSENVQAFITSPPLFSPIRTARVTSVLTESKLRMESTNSSVVFMSHEKSMNISDFNNTDLVASTPRPVAVIKGNKSTTVYNDTESHTAATISTNHTGLSSHLNQSIVSHKVSRSTQTSNKTIQPRDTSLATTAYVKVVWKSQAREKVLPPGVEERQCQRLHAGYLLQVVNEIILQVHGCSLYTTSLIPRNMLTVCLKSELS